MRLRGDRQGSQDGFHRVQAVPQRLAYELHRGFDAWQTHSGRLRLRAVPHRAGRRVPSTRWARPPLPQILLELLDSRASFHGTGQSVAEAAVGRPPAGGRGREQRSCGPRLATSRHGQAQREAVRSHRPAEAPARAAGAVLQPHAAPAARPQQPRAPLHGQARQAARRPRRDVLRRRRADSPTVCVRHHRTDQVTLHGDGELGPAARGAAPRAGGLERGWRGRVPGDWAFRPHAAAALPVIPMPDRGCCHRAWL
mmetsp:Transcript_595/g.1452  ORF Transcript_595/g.1452 Transcript_595/m.1452 type:complete len:254 (+) Transcript_595:634-1395(+)